MKNSLKLICLTLFLLGCSSKAEKAVYKAKKIVKKNPKKALRILDQALGEQGRAQDKLVILNGLENLIKNNIKKATYYKAVLIKKIHYLDNIKEKNQNKLLLAQLLIQNLNDQNGALEYLENMPFQTLTSKQREQYFQLVLVAYINGKKYDQALIEVDKFLKLKDLSPSEYFRIKQFKGRILSDQKKYAEAEKEYEELVSSYHNLAKKWKVRSQLALVYESQQKYKEAVEQLKLLNEEEKDPLLDWRIEELNKRIAQQPGAKGRLKR